MLREILSARPIHEPTLGAVQERSTSRGETRQGTELTAENEEQLVTLHRRRMEFTGPKQLEQRHTNILQVSEERRLRAQNGQYSTHTPKEKKY